MYKVLIAEFKHETNSFMPTPTGVETFRARNLLFGDEIIPYFTGVKSEVGAFLDCLAGDSEFTLVPVIAANAEPGGKVTREMFDLAQHALLDAVRRERPDGLLLALHGAMVVEDVEDGEGELLAALREVAGAETPIVASPDLHCNLTEKIVTDTVADSATICF